MKCLYCGQPITICNAYINWNHRHFDPQRYPDGYCHGYTHWHDAKHTCGPRGQVARPAKRTPPPPGQRWW